MYRHGRGVLHRGVTLQERLAARTFLDRQSARLAGLPAITASVGDLETVAARMIGGAVRARQHWPNTRLRRARALPKAG